MGLALYFINCIIMGVIAWEDFRERMISWVWLPLLAVVLLFYSPSALGVNWRDWVMNLLFLLVMISLSAVYFVLVKKVGIKEILSSYLGLGDVLFFVVSALAVPFIVFPVFFVLSMIMSLISGIVFLKEKTIPLAGIQSLILLLFISALQWDWLTIETVENILTL